MIVVDILRRLNLTASCLVQGGSEVVIVDLRKPFRLVKRIGTLLLTSLSCRVYTHRRHPRKKAGYVDACVTARSNYSREHNLAG